MMAARLVAEGNLKASLSQSSSCVSGSFSAGIGLDAGIAADFSVPNPASLMGTACLGVVGNVCKLSNVKIANCAVKVLTKVDPCKKAEGMCADMKKEIAKLTPKDLGKTFSGTAVILKPKFTPFQLTGKAYCTNGQEPFTSQADSIGAGKLEGGGGGKGIETCGAPGNTKKCEQLKGESVVFILKSQHIVYRIG